LSKEIARSSIVGSIINETDQEDAITPAIVRQTSSFDDTDSDKSEKERIKKEKLGTLL
jgi:hypothetical protein